MTKGARIADAGPLENRQMVLFFRSLGFESGKIA